MSHKSRGADLKVRWRNRRRKSRADLATRKAKQGKRPRQREIDALRQDSFYSRLVVSPVKGWPY